MRRFLIFIFLLVCTQLFTHAQQAIVPTGQNMSGSAGSVSVSIGQIHYITLPQVQAGVQQWTPNKYIITFNANGGLIPVGGNMGTTPAGHTTTLSTDCKSGTVVVTYGLTHFQNMKGDTPTRSGYTFDGWWTSATGGTQVYDAAGVCVKESAYWDANGKWIGTSNLIVYAHWTIKKYTITASGTNGLVTGGGTYNYNSSSTLTATPADCYTFARWSDGNTDNPRTVTVTGDATYTVIFDKMQYTITTAPDDAAHGTTEAVEKE